MTERGLETAKDAGFRIVKRAEEVEGGNSFVRSLALAHPACSGPALRRVKVAGCLELGVR